MTQTHPRSIAFFGHNSNDAAVRRRAIAFQRAGYNVTGFMPHRGPQSEREWTLVDLGETQDNAYAKRVLSVFSGAKTVRAHAASLHKADMIYARNLDMLGLAVRARHLCGLKTPIVYECLDVHHRLTGNDFVAKSLRRLERWLLARCSAVVISSPRFETEHFAVYYPNAYRSFLIENRLIEGDGFPDRPRPSQSNPTKPLRIGWFGNLRCKKSLGLLTSIARQFPDTVEISLRGYHAENAIPDFDAQIKGIPNLRFGGRYNAPQDLSKIYGEVDLIWAGDWYEEGANSLWLLPNRIYEGGYFGVPALAPSGTQTAAWLASKGGGFFVDEPVLDSLASTIKALCADRTRIDKVRSDLLALPRDVFVEDPRTVHDLFSMVVEA